MNKGLSFRDILTLPQMSKYREMELICPEMDSVMKPVVHSLGIDTKRPVQYVANLHRDAFNTIAVGFRVVGEIRTDKEYLKSGMCDIAERIIIAGKNDISLASELSELMNRTIDFKTLIDESSIDDVNDDFPTDQMEPDYLANLEMINQLNALLHDIRGAAFVRY